MTESDQNLLARGVCPDCGQPITRYFVSKNTPWCEGCDTYFTLVGGLVCRNAGATREYNEHWRGLVEEPADGEEDACIGT